MRKVWACLRREKLVVSRKRVWVLMATLRLLQQAVEIRNEDRRGTVAVATSNRRWATDFTTVWTRKDGLVAVVPVVDCGDRYLLACDVSQSQEARAVLAPVDRALRTAFASAEGVPDALELWSDHGPQYTGADCQDLCREWRLLHTLAPVGRPTGNAVAERVILTMKLEVIWARDWESAAELRQALQAWMSSACATISVMRRPHWLVRNFANIVIAGLGVAGTLLGSAVGVRMANENARAGWKVTAYDRFLAESWPIALKDVDAIERQRARTAALTLFGGTRLQRMAVEFDQLLLRLLDRRVPSFAERIAEDVEAESLRTELRARFWKIRDEMYRELGF